MTSPADNYTISQAYVTLLTSLSTIGMCYIGRKHNPAAAYMLGGLSVYFSVTQVLGIIALIQRKSRSEMLLYSESIGVADNNNVRLRK